jgi:DNA polymerase III subunit beta
MLKVLARAGELGAALAFVRRGLPTKSGIPILTTVLLEATDEGITLTGHTLNACHAAECAASVVVPGRVAVSAAKFFALVEATPAAALVTLEADDGRTIAISAGRSCYHVPILPAGDFPPALAVGVDAAAITLTPAIIAAQLVAVSSVASDDQTRMFLTGTRMTSKGGRLVTEATDGRVAARRTSSIAVPASWCPITVPTEAIDEIARMAGKRNNVTLRSDGRLLEATTNGFRFVSRLIGEGFPDTSRLVPAVTSSTATFATIDMMTALARLAAAASRDTPAAGLSWNGDDELRLVLADEEGAAFDAIAATTTGRGRVALAVDLMTKIMTAVGADRLRLSVEGLSDATVRLDVPDDEDVVAVISSRRWSSAAAVAA